MHLFGSYNCHSGCRFAASQGGEGHFIPDYLQLALRGPSPLAVSRHAAHVSGCDFNQVPSLSARGR